MMRLRTIEPEDLDLAYLIENDLSMWDVSSATAPISRYQLRQFITENTHDLYADRQLRLVIDVDGVGVGFADLFNFDPQHQRAEIGLVVGKQFAGSGYGKGALYLLDNFARNAHIHQLYAIVSATNSPCVKLLESTGYEITATLKDWVQEGENFTDAYILQHFLD